MLRKEWIDEGKLKPQVREDDEVMDDIIDGEAPRTVLQSSTDMSRHSSHDEHGSGVSGDDRVLHLPVPITPQAQTAVPQEEVEMDDLDALLAEEDSGATPVHPIELGRPQNDFADDEAAMAELGF